MISLSALLLESGLLWDSCWNHIFHHVRGLLSHLKAAREEVLLLCGRLDKEEATSTAEETPAPLPWKGGISGLKIVFFFPLLPLEDIIKMMGQTSFSLKRGGEAEKAGF
jgi:hypothetical protein